MQMSSTIEFVMSLNVYLKGAGSSSCQISNSAGVTPGDFKFAGITQNGVHITYLASIFWIMTQLLKQ